LSRERALDGFVFRTGRGDAGWRSAGMIVAAFFGRTQEERLERRLRRRLESAPRARDVEKQRRILTLPRLAVVLGRQAGIGEQCPRAIRERRRIVDVAAREGFGDEG